MDIHWDDAVANQFEGDLGQLVYATRLLSQLAGPAWDGVGRASLKRVEQNLLGDDEEILYIQSQQPFSRPTSASDFTPLRRERLARLAGLEALSAAQIENELACSRSLASAPLPPLDTLLHAALPYRYMLAGQLVSLATIACTPNGPDRLRELYGKSLLIVPYAPAGLPLARACGQALESATTADLAGMYVLSHGLITWGETAHLAYQRMVDFAASATEFLESQGAWNPSSIRPAEQDRLLRHTLAALRKAVSDAAGFPLILTVHPDPSRPDLSWLAELDTLAQLGPAFAGDIPLTRCLPMVGRNVQDFQQRYSRAREASLPDNLLTETDTSPRILLDAELGLCSLGRTANEARQAGQIFSRTLQIYRGATALEACQTMALRDAFLTEIASQSGLALAGDEVADLFRGEVALVTGGASGIGKACVEALLRRGAAVATFDINPKVETMFAQPGFLGLVCDLTDEQAISGAFETLERTFGGLDMLVLNAGIFPAGCRIESLSLAEWQRVMRINLDSNLVVLREAHPLLQQSPKGGRVLVNASKNVLAPGAGAAAYSASKAATTQLARVAALEWGKDRIRVNMIHPDAIFDTGIWTEAVLEARAAHYGMTVQQYKTRNVLGVELNSRYVGELVAEMLGPRFEKITGAQVPVDGGSDRVI